MSENRSPRHLAGPLHVTGKSRFVGEGALPRDMAHAVAVPSPHARARILGVDASEALRIPGVLAILTARDVPGENQIGHPILDEPLLPSEDVGYAGQPVALVVGETAWVAERAARLVRIAWQELPPVFTVEEALERGELYVPERRIERGDPDAALESAPHILEGECHFGGQEHFYLETQRCLAIPLEDGGLLLHSATQATSEVQEVAARVLGLSAKDVVVEVPRLGGGFGGKERGATLWSCLAALAAYRTRRPVLLKLTRHQDMSWTGKRHPFCARYRVGFDGKGKLLAYQVELDANGGAYADLSVAILERAMLHADNVYHVPNARIVGRACRTNLPPNTAFRGFGAPQGILAMETVLERIAGKLGLDPLEVRIRNAYREGEHTPFGQNVPEACAGEMLQRVARLAGYDSLRKEVDAWNASHSWLKRGLGIVPVKFGISFTTAFLNQGSALLWLYSDGTASLSHGGIEMGQEINTKVAQVVSRELGLSLDSIRVEPANTTRVGNASPTAASSGSDINGNAAQDAARQIRERLAPLAARLLASRGGLEPDSDSLRFGEGGVRDMRLPDEFLPMAELAHAAWMERVDLGAHGFYSTPGIYYDRTTGQGNPFYYFVWGAALVQAETDIRTGMSRLLSVHIVHETGQSLNPAVDRGQVAGAFTQGFGWCVLEEERNDARGRFLAVSPSTYKIPTIRDLPPVFVIELVERDRRAASVMGSKAVGEPPFVYGLAAWFAIRDALSSVAGPGREVELAHPASPEAVALVAESLQRERAAADSTEEHPQEPTPATGI